MRTATRPRQKKRHIRRNHLRLPTLDAPPSCDNAHIFRKTIKPKPIDIFDPRTVEHVLGILSCHTGIAPNFRATLQQIVDEHYKRVLSEHVTKSADASEFSQTLPAPVEAGDNKALEET